MSNTVGPYNSTTEFYESMYIYPKRFSPYGKTNLTQEAIEAYQKMVIDYNRLINKPAIDSVTLAEGTKLEEILIPLTKDQIIQEFREAGLIP